VKFTAIKGLIKVFLSKRCLLPPLTNSRLLIGFFYCNFKIRRLKRKQNLPQAIIDQQPTKRYDPINFTIPNKNFIKYFLLEMVQAFDNYYNFFDE
jgi:hypothetical protein